MEALPCDQDQHKGNPLEMATKHGTKGKTRNSINDKK